MRKFDALLLSAGYGKRLKPLTNYIPKPLVQIKGEILLNIWIKNLIKSGVDKIYINVFYKKNQITNLINNHPKKKKIKIINENKLHGTLGTLINHIENKRSLSKDLLVIHSDNYINKPLKDFVFFSQKNNLKSFGSLMIFKSNDHKNEGIVKYNKEFFLTKIYEKKKMKMGKYANCAIYYFNKKCLRLVIKKNFLRSEKDISRNLIPLLYKKIKVFFYKSYFLDIGTLKKLQKAQLLN